MIIVFPGDLIISGINVAKGAISVYQGKEPVCATIHYSSYTFDDKKVDLDYFKYFVKSPAFIFALQQQVKGGIKTEIKPKHLLPLEISLPDLSTQKEIVKVLSKKIEKVELIKSEIESQKAYAKQLRQNILQEAIEGKLTEEWRKGNPVVKGNPDFDAEALFEKIQEEKCHTDSELLRNSKKKVFEPILENEQPFEIPEGWKWVRLGEIYTFSNGIASRGSEKGTLRPVLRLADLSTGTINLSEVREIKLTDNEFISHRVFKDDLIFIRVNGSKEKVGTAFLYEKDTPISYCDHLFCGNKKALLVSSKFTMLEFNTVSVREQIMPLIKTTTGQNTINQGNMAIIKIPLPPLAEQKEIVSRVEKLLANVTELEEQIAERETLTKQLMQSIMKDAFREG